MTKILNADQSNYKDKLVLTYLLISIFLLIVLDITLDFIEGHSMKDMFLDLGLEGSLLVLVLFTTNFVWKKFTFEKEVKNIIEIDLEQTKELASHWERKSTDVAHEFQGFVKAQFIKWGLSKSEIEIAVLLLAGKSSKDMASHRFTSERTIRNQCRSIYEKSSLSGKAEFSAFFLNELVGDFQ